MKRMMVVMVMLMTVVGLGAIPEATTWWRMNALDAEGHVPDATGGGMDLELGSGVSLVKDRRFGHALEFTDATNSWTKSITTKAYPGSRTISLWTKRAANENAVETNTIPYVIAGVSGTAVNYGRNALQFRFCPHTAYAYGTANYTREEWHHTVFVLEDLGDKVYNISAYVDGVKDTKCIANNVELTLSNGASTIFVGNGSEGGVRPYVGRMADLRIYNQALTEDEVMAVFRDVPTYLAGYWPMEEITTNANGERIVVEATGSADDPVLEEPALEMTLGSANTLVAYNGGNALDYPNSENARGKITSRTDWRDWTLSLWLCPQTGMNTLYNPDTAEHNQNTISHIFFLNGALRAGMSDKVDTSTKVQVFDLVTQTDEWDQGKQLDILVQHGAWQHLAVVVKVYKENGVWYQQPDYYVNGEFCVAGRASTYDGYAGVIPSYRALLIGNSADSPQYRAFWGQMDDVALYHGRLTAEEVRMLYQGAATPHAGDDFTVSGTSAYLAGSLDRKDGEPTHPTLVTNATWSIVSTPVGGEGAAIETPSDVKTRVTLPVEGSYVFRLTTSLPGGLKKTDEVTVTRVAEGGTGGAAPETTLASAALTVTNDLVRYWRFDADLKDRVTGVVGANRDVTHVALTSGLDGYGIRVKDAFGGTMYYNTMEVTGETTSDTSYQMPDNRWLTISAWIYHDGNDTNISSHAMIVGQPYSFGLWYNCESDRGFTLYQQTLNTAICGVGNTNSYPRPAVDPLNRWTHVCAVFDRQTHYTQNASELWVDGVLLEKRNPSWSGMGATRVKNDSNVIIGGAPGTNTAGNNEHFPDANGKAISRTFPGVIDEVRMYHRKLSQEEIQFLAANPVMGARETAAIGATARAKFMATRSTTFAGETDVVGDVTYTWRVLTGDAAAVAFANPNAAETTATVRKAGTYEVQLVVTDARGQKTYSTPIVFEVAEAGTVIVVR